MTDVNENKLSGKIVIDMIFEAMSANYDQGTGNFQELKKITMPDGTVHTLISRYALRYSILDTMNGFADGSVLDKSKGEKGTIQPVIDKLLNGELFKDNYEFVLFGFLIAADNQIQRENPVKISHAISLTPFTGDVLMYGNHSFASRISKGKLDIDLFNKEEHHSLYAMNVVIDLDEMKEFSFYYKGEVKGIDNENIKISKDGDKVTIKFKDKLIQEAVKKFINALIHLKRTHQGSQKILPKLLRIKYYSKKEGAAYDTIIDKISVDSGYEEVVEIEEEEAPLSNGKGNKIIRKAVNRKLRTLTIRLPDLPVPSQAPSNLLEYIISSGKTLWIEPSPGASKTALGGIRIEYERLE